MKRDYGWEDERDLFVRTLDKMGVGVRRGIFDSDGGLVRMAATLKDWIDVAVRPQLQRSAILISQQRDHVSRRAARRARCRMYWIKH